jgi:hypothetical protein
MGDFRLIKAKNSGLGKKQSKASAGKEQTSVLFRKFVLTSE